MSPTQLLRSTVFVTLAGLAAAQERAPAAYPERDLLSPFRHPTDVYAPPDELFRLLRSMRRIADQPGAAKSYDERGREVVDDAGWRDLMAQVEQIGVDAAYLAQILRLHRDADERATACYAMFYCPDVENVLNLISHIPGEPVRQTREAALPRAIRFVQAHLGRRFGDLDDDRKKALLAAMPQPGSPVARARGIQRLPTDADPLYHGLRLVPFFQLLDLDDADDQAQGLWFLKEVFRLRIDQAQLWLEPALPRVRELLASPDTAVQNEAIGLLQAIGPRDLPAPPLESPAALQAWAATATKTLFPPIRNLNDAVVQLHASPERSAIVAAGREALANSSIGDPFQGRLADGQYYRGFRVVTVPEALQPLAIPAGAVITAVNGVQVTDAASLLRTLQRLLDQPGPRKLMVDYVRGDKPHAVEYRVL
ncbi:MAG: hypothetical protein JNL08_04385 [Planctomycetes bacterium]|nr:hypothetical protein [Planctomycetota bacterium]